MPGVLQLPSFVVQTLKYRAGITTVWVCIWWFGHGPLITLKKTSNAEGYGHIFLDCQSRETVWG